MIKTNHNNVRHVNIKQTKLTRTKNNNRRNNRPKPSVATSSVCKDTCTKNVGPNVTNRYRSTNIKDSECNCQYNSLYNQGVVGTDSVACTNGSPDDVARGNTFAPDWDIDEVQRRIPYTIEMPVKQVDGTTLIDMSPYYPYPTYWYEKQPHQYRSMHPKQFWKGYPIYNTYHPVIEGFKNEYCKSPYFYIGMMGLVLGLMAMTNDN
jgi:hypothetical protein